MNFTAVAPESKLDATLPTAVLPTALATGPITKSPVPLSIYAKVYVTRPIGTEATAFATMTVTLAGVGLLMAKSPAGRVAHFMQLNPRPDARGEYIVRGRISSWQEHGVPYVRPSGRTWGSFSFKCRRT